MGPSTGYERGQSEVESAFRRRLRILMAVTGTDSNRLAAATGQSSSAVRKWLAGRRLPSSPALRSLSLELGVPADWLLGASALEMLKNITELPGKVLGKEVTGDGGHEREGTGGGQKGEGADR